MNTLTIRNIPFDVRLIIEEKMRVDQIKTSTKAIYKLIRESVTRSHYDNLIAKSSGSQKK